VGGSLRLDVHILGSHGSYHEYCYLHNSSFETLLTSYQTAWHYITKDSNVHIYWSLYHLTVKVFYILYQAVVQEVSVVSYHYIEAVD
jgi:hypothetical protein